MFKSYYDREVVSASELPVLTQKQIDDAVALLETGNKLPENERWSLPFPMGVFGTLRQGRGNNYLMHHSKVSGYARAFMPHFIASGLTIYHSPNASAPFEVFYYEGVDWGKMIPSVDSLEGFSPSSERDSRWGGYYRTLAWLHVLPKEFKHELYETVSLGTSRDLRIDSKTWTEYTRILCWVYSSRNQNKAAEDAKLSPVIWG
jgi:gamma-glutamylcyclotransferase (GGCT)/AIG2-like uncharacterized protein YtfP